jgi:hypothetical protein
MHLLLHLLGLGGELLAALIPALGGLLLLVPGVGVLVDGRVILGFSLLAASEDVVPPGGLVLGLLLLLILLLVVVAVLMVRLEVQVLLSEGIRGGSSVISLLALEGGLHVVLMSLLVVLRGPGRVGLGLVRRLVLLVLGLLLIELVGLFLVRLAAGSKSVLACLGGMILLSVVLLADTTLGGPPVARVVLRLVSLLMLLVGRHVHAPLLLDRAVVLLLSLVVVVEVTESIVGLLVLVEHLEVVAIGFIEVMGSLVDGHVVAVHGLVSGGAVKRGGKHYSNF